MKLVDLRLERLPGIRQEFSLQPGGNSIPDSGVAVLGRCLENSR